MLDELQGLLNVCRFLIKNGRRHNWEHRRFQTKLVAHRYKDYAHLQELMDLYDA